MNYYLKAYAGNVGWMNETMTEHKCVVFVGDEKDNNVCGREAIHGYESKVQIQNGKLVNETLFVCDRHQQVFEEFMNEQGEYQ